jgi:hypothetical protein
LKVNQIFDFRIESNSLLILVDCYDGKHMEPIVYHGHTLTVAITVREILTAIETVAFTASP